MAKVCPRCKGTGKRGKQLCQLCNPSGAFGDIVLGALGRLWYRIAGKSVTTDGRTTRRRAHRFGTETVAITAADKRARLAGRQRQAKASQPPARRKGTAARTTRQAEVRGQQTSTASTTGRCEKCRGVYGLTKGRNVRAHKDLTTGHRCPGSGRPAKAGRPRAAQRQEPQRPAGPGLSLNQAQREAERLVRENRSAIEATAKKLHKHGRI